MTRKSCSRHVLRWSQSRYRHSQNILISFNERPWKGVVNGVSNLTWLNERDVITLGRLPSYLARGKDALEIKAVNKMMDLYERMSNFCWPTGWKTLVSNIGVAAFSHAHSYQDDLPSVDLNIMHARETLFSQYTTYIQGLATTELLSQSDDHTNAPTFELSPLDSDLTNLLSGCFSAVLLASDNTRELNKFSTKRGVYEVEFRRYWDSLLYSLFIVKGDASISSNVM